MSADPGPILQQVHAALQRHHVYVDPSLSGQVSTPQLRAIEQATDQAEQGTGHPLFVVIYPYRTGDPFSGRPSDLLTRLHQQYPLDGVYLSSTTQLRESIGDYHVGIGVDGAAFGVPDSDAVDFYQLDFVVAQEQQPDLGAAFARASELTAQGPTAVDQVYERLFAAYERTHDLGSSTGDSSRDGDGSSGGLSAPVVAGVLGAVLVVVVLTAVGVLLRRRRAVGRDRPFALPESALDHIRDAHDRRLEQQAREERLALGERIDATDLAPSGSSALASWQAALDRYDASAAVLDRRTPPDVLDVVGALVLLRQGSTALDAAQRQRDWAPPATCYLDPLHGPARTRRLVEPADAGARSREVPLCGDCRADLDAGRGPDILDVERHGRAVHYFDSGVEPWASTGYGCFGDDLVVALNRSS